MRLHVAAKKGRHAGERLVVHLFGTQTFVVIFIDVDVGDGMLAHTRSLVAFCAANPGAAAASSRWLIGMRVSTSAPTISKPATNHSPELKLPVASRKMPINSGLTAEPTLPIALITANATARDCRLITRSGVVQNIAIAVNDPVEAMMMPISWIRL